MKQLGGTTIRMYASVLLGNAFGILSNQNTCSYFGSPASAPPAAMTTEAKQAMDANLCTVIREHNSINLSRRIN